MQRHSLEQRVQERTRDLLNQGAEEAAARAPRITIGSNVLRRKGKNRYEYPVSLPGWQGRVLKRDSLDACALVKWTTEEDGGRATRAAAQFPEWIELSLLEIQ